MNTTSTLGTIALCGLAWFADRETAPETAAIVELPAPPSVCGRSIDLAICLDTSGSMSGLIDAARQKIWAIVNDLALAQPQPKLRVALLTFGNDGHNAENGWVEVQTALTTDLDVVSQRLFALATNGGNEYVGRAVDRATRELDWSAEPGTLKLIVVAGNESAFQDPDVPAPAAARRAIERGILVNTVYCGGPNDGHAPSWREVARLADGHFATIDHQNGTVVVTTPFDTELVELSAALNTTYVPYGAAGRGAWLNQRAQDENAAQLNSEAAAARAACKVSGLYDCSGWDLVDACREGKLELADVDADELPEEMRAMTLEQQRVHLSGLSSKRAELQVQIAKLNAQRQAFVENEMREQALDATRSLDHVLRAQIRQQAQARGFAFEAAEAPVANPVASSSTSGVTGG